MGSINVQGGGFDLRKYENINYHASVSVPTANVFQTVLNITGEGFLSYASIHVAAGNKIRVTIDGVVKHYSIGAIATQEYILYDSTTPANIVLPVNTLSSSYYVGQSSANTIFPYPNTAGASGGYVILDFPIFFKQSLLVEVNCTATGNKTICIKGGVKA